MKITLITGATGGLGKAFARLYAKDGNNLLLSGTNAEKLAAMQAELQGEFPDALVDVFQADLTDRAACKALYAYTQEKGYFVNNLVNNAGFGDCNAFAEMDVDTQLNMLDVNCAALLYFTRMFLTDMLQNDEGHIINVSSMAAFMPSPYMSTYHASKAYVLYLGEAIAHEIRKTKVRILTLCPGPFDSGFVGKAGNDYTFEKIKPIPAEKVAEYGYKKSQKGKRVAVVGFGNKLTTFLPRLFSRKFVTTVAASTARKNG